MINYPIFFYLYVLFWESFGRCRILGHFARVPGETRWVRSNTLYLQMPFVPLKSPWKHEGGYRYWIRTRDQFARDRNNQDTIANSDVALPSRSRYFSYGCCLWLPQVLRAVGKKAASGGAGWKMAASVTARSGQRGTFEGCCHTGSQLQVG